LEAGTLYGYYKNVIKIYIKVVKICVYTQINLKTVSFINFYNIIIKQ